MSGKVKDYFESFIKCLLNTIVNRFYRWVQHHNKYQEVHSDIMLLSKQPWAWFLHPRVGQVTSVRYFFMSSKYYWLTASSTGQLCNEDGISRFIETNGVQWIQVWLILCIADSNKDRLENITTKWRSHTIGNTFY